MQHSILKFLMVGITCSLLVACTPDSSTVNPEELITTIRLNFKNSSKSFRYKIVNSVVSVDTIFINKNFSDTFNVEVLDESKSPSRSYTAEIKAERNDHQLFYNVSNGLNLSTRYLDKDDKDFPVGLSVEITTTAPSKGSLNIVLKHQPDVKNGSITAGSTDADATFPVVIQ